MNTFHSNKCPSSDAKTQLDYKITFNEEYPKYDTIIAWFQYLQNVTKNVVFEKKIQTLQRIRVTKEMMFYKHVKFCTADSAEQYTFLHSLLLDAKKWEKP